MPRLLSMEVIGALSELALAEGWTPQEQAAMEAELQRGWHSREVIVKEQEVQARKEAAEFRDFHHKKSIWKPVLSIPQQEYEEIVAHHGARFFADRANIRWLQNKFPDFRGAKV